MVASEATKSEISDAMDTMMEEVSPQRGPEIVLLSLLYISAVISTWVITFPNSIMAKQAQADIGVAFLGRLAAVLTVFPLVNNLSHC